KDRARNMKEAKLESSAIPKSNKPRTAAGPTALAGVSKWPSKTKGFLDDVRAEMKRVTWPNFSQIRATTVVVLVTVALFSVYFWILDTVFTKAVGRLLRIGS